MLHRKEIKHCILHSASTYQIDIYDVPEIIDFMTDIIQFIPFNQSGIFFLRNPLSISLSLYTKEIVNILSCYLCNTGHRRFTLLASKTSRVNSSSHSESLSCRPFCFVLSTCSTRGIITN